MKNKTIFFLTVTVFLLCLTACRKTIRIQPNLSTLVTSQAFASPGQARSVLAAAYFGLINNSTGFASGQITYYTGLSADEFILYDINAQAENEFFQNNIVSTNPLIGVNLWSSCFSTLFIANSTIENIERSEFADSVKNDLIGQARFLRAFCNFYLVNIFGEIPLVTTSNWQKTQLLPRSSVKEVYDLIVSDLLFAEGHLSKAYSANNNERIVANQYAATALLARVYLYLQDWKNAEAAASGLINEKNVFSLEDLNRIYAPDSKEAIWQLKQLNS
ncbi:MAG: RagB/SusD family nutrient uptake outer membrane protein, partial [Niabella sp.]|nr:RagB/SusD family nutrient uptake outer membrane protein [Niabella sp.]